MLKLSGLKTVPGDTDITRAICRKLNVCETDIKNVKILRRSVDARRGQAHFVYTVAFSAKNEKQILKKRLRDVSPYKADSGYTFPYVNPGYEKPVVIAGMGPAGMFAALCLARAGVRCILLERGRSVGQRTADVQRFWRTGELDETSNVQFGEGGAGTFSDGKLTTGVNDKRIPFVLKTFTEFGAPEDIEYLSKPHIGTDKLRTVVKNIREELIRLGCDVRFETKLTGIELKDGAVKAAVAEHCGKSYELETENIILAPGNSARDTFEMLDRSGVKLSPKNFAVGVRLEHRQQDIDKAQYREAATLGTLPASDYKLAVHLPEGRSVYTFCVCPGGTVVAAASEQGMVVTNGMSEYARDGENCNGGLLVSVMPEDFGGTAMGGIRFQRSLEQAAFNAGGGNYSAPCETVKDFLEKRRPEKLGSVKPTYSPGVRLCSLWDVLPEFVCTALKAALPEMGKKIRGFDAPDAVMTAVETRSSCPVRIDRENFQAVGIKGLFPCGEGAGYAGGITTAAADGIKCAEAVCERLIK